MGYSHKTVVSNIDKWLGWLDDPDLQQTKGKLCRESTIDEKTSTAYCCLGVGAEKVLQLKRVRSFLQDTVPLSSTVAFGVKYNSRYLEEEGLASASEEIIPGFHFQALGLWSGSGERRRDSGNKIELLSVVIRGYDKRELREQIIDSLADLNDNGYTFAQIRNVLLVDLRTDGLGFFKPAVRKAWRGHHGFTF